MEKGDRRIICVEELCSRVVQEGYIKKILDRIAVMTEDMDLEEDKINAALNLEALRKIVSKHPSKKWNEAALNQKLEEWNEMSDLVLLAVEFLRATSPSSEGAEEVPEVEDQIDLQDTLGTNGTSGTIGTIGEEDEDDNVNDIEEEGCEDNNSNADTKSFDDDGDGGKDHFHNRNHYNRHHVSNYDEEEGDDGQYDDQYDDSDFEESDGGVEETNNNETYNVQQKYVNYRPQTAVTVAVASDDDDEYMEDYEQYNSDEDDKLVMDNCPPQPPARVSSAPPGNIRGGASPSPPPQPPISERAQTAPPQNSQSSQHVQNSSNNRLLVPPPKISQYEPSAGASSNGGNSSNSGNSNGNIGGVRLGEQKEKVSASRSKENMNPRWVEQGKYKIGNSIGKGQFGEVFQCLNTITGKLYAVKRLLITSKANASAIEQEYKLLVGLEHPNIVTFIGYNLKNEPYCELFQDFVSSGSLQALIDRYGTLDESVVKIYTRQILEGLKYLHSKGIIHRDIKPANILFEKDGVLKLADFGASVQMEDDFNVTAETKTIRGTPYFMAPEVLKENHYGRKGDIWAVGCTIVQMLTGEVPWKRNKVKTLIQLHCLLETLQNGHTPLDYYKGGKCDLSKREKESRLAAEEADALPKKPEMSLELRHILEMCFEKDSKKRPFPQELLDDLYFVMVDRDENEESMVASKKDFGEELHEKIDSSHSIFRQNGVHQAPMTGYGKASSNVPLPVPPPTSSSSEPQPPPMINTGRRPTAAPPGGTAAELASKKINPFSSKANFKTPSRSSSSGGGSGGSSSSSSSARDDDVSPPIQSNSKSTRASDEDINVMHGSMEKI